VRGIDARALWQLVPALAIVGTQVPRERALPAIALVLLAVAVVRVVAWQRHTFEITPDAIVERRGIVNRRERTVQLARLQQVEIDRSVADRLLGTAVLRLETASDASEAELELKVVDLADAHRLRAALLPRATAGGGPPPRELVHVPLHHVALASVTGRRLLFIPVVIGAAIGMLEDLDLFSTASDAAEDVLAAAGIVAGAVLVIAVLVVSVLVALVVGVLRDGEFRIREVGDDLHVQRGILATRQAVLPRTRLQQVTVRHGLVRRRLGFASLTLHSAGGGGGDDDATAERQLTVPLVPTERAHALVRDLLPEAGALPELVGHPPRARRRARVRYLLGSAWLVLPTAGAVGSTTRAWTPTLLAVGAVAFAVAASSWWLGRLDHQRRGSAVGERWIVARSGALSPVEAIAPRAKAQGTRVVSTPFQRRHGLVTLLVQVAGPAGSVAMLDLDQAGARSWAAEIVGGWAVGDVPTRPDGPGDGGGSSVSAPSAGPTPPSP
jgi:putative membrane protein